MLRTSAVRRLLTRVQHPSAERIVQQAVSVPPRSDLAVSTMNFLSWSTFAVTYGIIVNWIYSAHLDHWDGTYGVDDDDDDDDD